MSARVRYAVELLLTRFQQTWAEAAAWRVTHAPSGDPSEATLQDCRALAQKLFEPALWELHKENFQVIVAIEELLDRLDKSDQISS